MAPFCIPMSWCKKKYYWMRYTCKTMRLISDQSLFYGRKYQMKAIFYWDPFASNVTLLLTYAGRRMTVINASFFFLLVIFSSYKAIRPSMFFFRSFPISKSSFKQSRGLLGRIYNSSQGKTPIIQAGFEPTIPVIWTVHIRASLKPLVSYALSVDCRVIPLVTHSLFYCACSLPQSAALAVLVWITAGSL